jgi:acylphosphatase
MDEPRLERGRAYEHDDGTVEVVFAAEDGRVLTVREYPTRETCLRVLDAARFRGTNEAVLDLPDVDAFEE